MVLAVVLASNGALAGNTIGGLNMLAALLACMCAVIGVIVSMIALAKQRKPRRFFMLALFAQLAIGSFAIALFWIRDFAMGYGP